MTVAIRHRSVFIRTGKILAFSAAILIATKLTLEFAALTSASTAAFSFLIIVLLSAFFGDLLVAIITSFMATLCFDYFYLPPVGTFHIDAFQDWVSLAAFLVSSVIISHLTASASENSKKASVLDQSLAQLRVFGEWLLSAPNYQLTLSDMVKEAQRIFALEYCSIHVYGEGKWQHFTGTSASYISQEIENQLKILQDHPTDLMELADENMLGVRYVQINKGATPFAVLAVRSSILPTHAIGTIAYMIGVKLGRIGEVTKEAIP